ncbi:hypothetical protein Tco_0881289, partial [Tanacetum coccineum]
LDSDIRDGLWGTLEKRRCDTWFKLMIGVYVRVTKETKNTKTRVVGCGLVKANVRNLIVHGGGSITDIRSVLTQKNLDIFCQNFHIPDEVHPQLPSPNQTIHEMPTAKIGVYTRFFEYANSRLPLSTFLVDVLSRNYTLDENTYPEFLRDNDDEMDLLSFIRTTDPTKVRVGERQRVEGEPNMLATTVGRVVSLLPVAPDRTEGELEVSVDKLFDEGGSGNQTKQGNSAVGGQGAGIQLVSEDTDTIVEDVAPLQPRRKRKRKTVVVDSSEPSYPAKKLREDHGTPSGVSVAGKSVSAVQRLFAGAVLNAEVKVEAIPTLPFVTSFVSATPEHE